MNGVHSIISISGIRAFDSFEWQAPPAKRYNLIYGWNGAGKSTIGRILSFFEQRDVHLDEFRNVRFRVRTTNGTLTERDVSAGRIEVRVFNDDFVRRNVQFETSLANPIVIVGERNIEFDKEIRSLEQSLEGLVAKQAELVKKRTVLPDVTKVLTECGTAVVNEFLRTSFATHRYYGRSYNRSRVQDLIDGGAITEDNASSLVMSDVEAERIREQLQARHTEVTFNSPDLRELRELFAQGNRLLTRVVAVVAFQKLEEDDELRSWIREGHRLHTERGATTCYFCDNPLPPGLLAQYGAYFTEEVIRTEAEIRAVVERLRKVEEELREQPPDSSKFFADLRTQYVQLRSDINEHWSAVLIACNKLRTRLEDRLGRVQLVGSEAEQVPFPEESFAALNAGFAAIVELCRKHNELVTVGKQDLENAARRLELHTVAKILLSREYFKSKAELESIDKAIEEVEKAIRDVQRKLEETRAAMEDISTAVNAINGVVAEFLGPGEIELTIHQTDGKPWRYQINRKGAPTSYLSEGEKSVVALAYFLVKLREEGSNLHNTIVVLDDPVDSQDSVFLFRTYGLLKRELQEAGQLFILTHNYELFNLVRDWFSSQPYYEYARLYWIEVRRSNEYRSVVVRDLPDLLRDHKSEYQYLFYRLYAHKEKVEPLHEPLIPNVARKVLEYFASFKWSCRSSEDLGNIVQTRFITHNNHLRRAVGDAILKFINEYSHGRDFGRPVTAAVLEAESVCDNVLHFIRLSDKVHYDYLVSHCRTQTRRPAAASRQVV